MGLPAAARGLNVHWLSAARTEEVSSADSDGSVFIHNEFGMCRTITEIDHLSGSSRKKSSDQFEFEAAAENDVTEAGRSSSRASNDDENGINTRKKLGLSKQQSAFLEESFKEHNTLNTKCEPCLVATVGTPRAQSFPQPQKAQNTPVPVSRSLSEPPCIVDKV
ncbi:hypothetical protein OROGR_022208 [Orobanche gracilis]